MTTNTSPQRQASPSPWRTLDIFSGIGGFTVAAEKVWGSDLETLAFCEIDPHARKILAKHWPSVPIYQDIAEISAERLRRDGITGAVDLICGGFPCQDVSSAWAGPGLDGARSGLWSEYARIIYEFKPRYVVIENVANLRKRGLGIVLDDLARGGYNASWQIVGANDVGAPHERKRMWIVAWREWEPVVLAADCIDLYGDREVLVCINCGADYSECACLGPHSADDEGYGLVEEDWGLVAYPDSAGCEEQRRSRAICPQHVPDECYRRWQAQPPVLRVDDGIPGRVESIRRLGNSIVPAVAEVIMRGIAEAQSAG